MMVYDSPRAMDYLVSRDDVGAKRIGTVGLSKGSAIALDERVKGHGIYYYVPGLLKHFTTSRMNALIAPRHHLAQSGIKDGSTPPKGRDRVDADLKQAYLAAGHPERWELKRYDYGHQEIEEMRTAARDYFVKESVVNKA